MFLKHVNKAVLFVLINFVCVENWSACRVRSQDWTGNGTYYLGPSPRLPNNHVVQKPKVL